MSKHTRRTNLKLARFLKLCPVALTLDGAAGRQEYVLVVPVHVFDPVRKPSDCIVVNDFLPGPRNVRGWDGNVLSDVDRNILWTDAKLRTPRLATTRWRAKGGYLEGTFLGMVATTTEKTRRFNAEVANLLFTTVERTVGIRRLERILRRFRCFLLRRCH